MKVRKANVFWAGLVILSLLLLPVLSQPAQAKSWKWEVAPYIWMMGMDGSATVKGQKVDVKASFSDILEDLNFAFLGYVEAHRGPWSIYFDGSYLLVSQTATGPVATTDVDVTTYLVDFGASYEVASGPMGQGGRVAFDVLGGGRYTYLKGKIKVRGLGSIEDSYNFIDPIVGLRLRADFSPSWSFNFRGDIGGFGLGSELTYKVQALVGYRFNQMTALWLGYRYQYFDYKEGSGAGAFRIKMGMHGPMLGLSFSF